MFSSSTPLPVSIYYINSGCSCNKPPAVQLMQTNDVRTIYKLPFTSLVHFLRTHFWQHLHNLELLLTLSLHPMQGHFPFFSTLSAVEQLTKHYFHFPSICLHTFNFHFCFTFYDLHTVPPYSQPPGSSHLHRIIAIRLITFDNSYHYNYKQQRTQYRSLL